MKLPRYNRSGPMEVRFRITGARVAVFLLIVALATACGAMATDNAQTIEVRAQDAIATHYNQAQPVPAWNVKSQIRQNLTEIEHAEAIGVQTTSFECATNDGCDPTHPPIKSCPSIGSPIPITDQLTNPEQPLRDNSQPLNNGGGNVTVGEMDPNGIYKGAGSGTYVLCIRPGGAVEPSYFEGLVLVEYGPAVWKQGQGIVDIGPPSFQFTH